MSVKQMIEFVESKGPITEAVTKFGGQPVWVDKPQWPVSKRLKKPMQFICQIKIDPALFGECPAQMAYLFMTDDSDDPGMYDTWDPDGGENAVIVNRILPTGGIGAITPDKKKIIWKDIKPISDE